MILREELLHVIFKYLPFEFIEETFEIPMFKDRVMEHKDELFERVRKNNYYSLASFLEEANIFDKYELRQLKNYSDIDLFRMYGHVHPRYFMVWNRGDPSYVSLVKNMDSKVTNDVTPFLSTSRESELMGMNIHRFTSLAEVVRAERFFRTGKFEVPKESKEVEGKKVAPPPRRQMRRPSRPQFKS